jgi:hypothetical protein
MTTPAPPHTIVFRRRDAGIVADGTYGHEHVREVLASVLKDVAASCPLCRGDESIKSLVGSLLSDPDEWPSDLGDEDEAIDVLNQHAEGVEFEQSNGDIVLWEIPQDD